INKQFRRELTEVAQLVLGASAIPTLSVDASLALNVSMERENRAVAPQRKLPAANEATRGAETDLAPIPSRPAIVNSGGRQRRLADLGDFIPTPLAEFALTACRHVATAPGTQFNPLFLYGSVGTGKTHLLEGICRQLRRTHSQLQVTLLTAEAFANYFTQALTERTLPSFRHKFRGVDVLLVDDVDFFESKRVFQEEFLHTICDLADHGRQVVVTADRHPRLLTKLGDDLVSRFQSGLICRLETPDSETRRQIVLRKAQRMDGDFAPEALQFVAERFTGSVRELEGALNCLQTFYGMTQKRITAATARQVLADLERDCLRVVRLADIERVVCQVFGLKPKDLKSDSRVRTLAQPRMLAMFLARKHTQSAYSEIGQHFGGRNHSTVMSAERKVQKWLEENATVRVASQSWSFQEIVINLEQQLLAG
ncbi:MAG: chromosomal replication initiator protein DnaA, partial [Planctomycetales bacterium 12-60-4]